MWCFLLYSDTDFKMKNTNQEIKLLTDTINDYLILLYSIYIAERIKIIPFPSKMGEKRKVNWKLALNPTETLLTWAFASAVQQVTWLAHAPGQASLQ